MVVAAIGRKNKGGRRFQTLSTYIHIGGLSAVYRQLAHHQLSG